MGLSEMPSRYSVARVGGTLSRASDPIFFTFQSRRKLGQKAAWRLHVQLSLRFCRESFNSGDFLLFSLVASPVQGGYTCDFDRALATRQNLKKSYHLREQKIARVATALTIHFILTHYCFNFICDCKWHKINLLDGIFCKSVA